MGKGDLTDGWVKLFDREKMGEIQSPNKIMKPIV